MVKCSKGAGAVTTGHSFIWGSLIPISYLIPIFFSGQCEAGYSCYTKECSSPGGPDDFVKALENPATKVDPIIHFILNDALKKYTCSEDLVNLGGFCCRDASAASAINLANVKLG